MKSVQAALHLHHHKHTGKLIHHRHTSYRVLFLLMLAPIIMLALVGQLARAADLVVTAAVPAPIPVGAPVITSPVNNSSTTSQQVLVSGTCPTIDPAIIVAIYDSGLFVGSAECSADGMFSVGVHLAAGTHVLTATVMTVTGGVGASSSPVTITVTSVNNSGSYVAGIPALPLHIMQNGVYLVMDADGNVRWQGHIEGGSMPYYVRIDWGDGTNDTLNVTSQQDREFTHVYKEKRTYRVTIYVTDAVGVETSQQVVAVTLVPDSGRLFAGTDFDNSQTSTPIALLRQYIVQIYIISLFGLIFLWYWERGRHMTSKVKVSSRVTKSRHRR